MLNPAEPPITESCINADAHMTSKRARLFSAHPGLPHQKSKQETSDV